MQVIITQNVSLLTLLHFTIIYALQVTYLYCICIRKKLYNNILLCISSQVQPQGCHVGSLKSAVARRCDLRSPSLH